MKSVLGVLVLLFSFSVSSTECSSAVYEYTSVSFSYISNSNFYSCSFAEREAATLLLQLGADDINVRCRGGLPDSRSLFVTANFYRAVFREHPFSGACREQVSLRYNNDSCDFRERMIDKFLTAFEVGHKNKRSSCWDSRGSLRYSFSILK